MPEIKRVYQNSTELMNLAGLPFYMADIADACLYGRLNLFLQGDTGSGKTQLAKDVMNYFGTTVGDGNFAKDIQEKFPDKLDEKFNYALTSMNHFNSDKTMFLLGRNDMDTRELFQRFNLGKLTQKPKHNLEPLIDIETGDIDYYYPVFENGSFIQKKLSYEQVERVRERLEKLSGTSEEARELTSKIKTNLFVIDELPNCIPAVRAQLFNLFDGFMEINGNPYQIGSGYSVGIATGNVGQKFTESNNDLGRAIKDRMHVIIDTDYFKPTAWDTFNILANNTNPRVNFEVQSNGNLENKILDAHSEVTSAEIPFEKLVLVNYLIHGLDYVNIGGRETTKTKMKDAWPNAITNHGAGSDEALILPVSQRAAKSILRLSQAFDYIARQKGASEEEVKEAYFDSVMQAFRFVGAYSGILNDIAVRENYGNDKYSAIDAVTQTTKTQYESQLENISAGLHMVSKGKGFQKVLNAFNGRWGFMRNFLEKAVEQKSGGK
jgi:hypothetical protein